MMLREIGPFTLDWQFWHFDDLTLCADELCEWFDFDPNRPLWVAVHDRPAKHRLRLTNLRPKFPKDEDWSDWLLDAQTSSGGSVPITISINVAEFARRNLPPTFYVEIVQEAS